MCAPRNAITLLGLLGIASVAIVVALLIGPERIAGLMLFCGAFAIPLVAGTIAIYRRFPELGWPALFAFAVVLGLSVFLASLVGAGLDHKAVNFSAGYKITVAAGAAGVAIIAVLLVGGLYRLLFGRHKS
jgi:hypothetical protein